MLKSHNWCLGDIASNQKFFLNEQFSKLQNRIFWHRIFSSARASTYDKCRKKSLIISMTVCVLYRSDYTQSIDGVHSNKCLPDNIWKKERERKSEKMKGTNENNGIASTASSTNNSRRLAFFTHIESEIMTHSVPLYTLGFILIL